MNLDKLDNIKRVETPPFLFTRIQQRVANQYRERVSNKLVWTLSASFAVILVLNAFALFNLNDTPTNTESYAQTMGISTNNNNLYK